jgi:hypothetical protein
MILSGMINSKAEFLYQVSTSHEDWKNLPYLNTHPILSRASLSIEPGKHWDVSGSAPGIRNSLNGIQETYWYHE